MNAVQQVESMMELEDMRKHILVVDDDSRMLKVVKVHLKAKYNVATAINGKLAMKFLEKKKTDLILLDYQMPGENGPEIFEKLKSNPDTKDIPVVFLTGVDDMKKVQEVLKLKPQGYLLKPIEHDKLISTIEGLIG
jgi:CheY-like chemotaxis protein